MKEYVKTLRKMIMNEKKKRKIKMMGGKYMDCRSCKYYIVETKDIPPIIKVRCDKGGVPYHFYKDCDDFEKVEKYNTNEYIY